MIKEKAKIYTLFLPCYIPRKNEILNKLHESCKDANFIGFDELSGIMDGKGAKVQKHFYMDEYGLHRSAIYSDIREKIKDIGNLLGFEVIEEDK